MCKDINTNNNRYRALILSVFHTTHVQWRTRACTDRYGLCEFPRPSVKLWVQFLRTEQSFSSVTYLSAKVKHTIATICEERPLYTVWVCDTAVARDSRHVCRSNELAKLQLNQSYIYMDEAGTVSLLEIEIYLKVVLVARTTNVDDRPNVRLNCHSVAIDRAQFFSRELFVSFSRNFISSFLKWRVFN